MFKIVYIFEFYDTELKNYIKKKMDLFDNIAHVN